MHLGVTSSSSVSEQFANGLKMFAESCTMNIAFIIENRFFELLFLYTFKYMYMFNGVQ